MSAPALEVGGVTVLAPVTVLTNVLLAVQALWLTRRPAPPSSPARPGWRSFLQVMAVAAAAGAVKHGTTPGWLHDGARVLSNVAVGGALTLQAWRGTAGAEGFLRRTRRLLPPGFAAFVAATVAWPSFLVVVVYLGGVSAVVVAAELAGAVAGRPGSGLALAALCLAGVAAAAYLAPVTVEPWLNGVDVAHVVLLGTFTLLAAADAAAARLP